MTETASSKPSSAPASRVELADHIESAFTDQPCSRDDLVLAARRTGARGAVLDAIGSLPDRSYRHLVDLWEHLPSLPIEPDE